LTYKYIGKSVVRIDAISKVNGQAKYVGDIKMPGMLYGKILRSTVAHANIKRIDVSKAKALPGVKAVITWQDVPRNPYCTAGHPYPDDSPLDTYILDNKVRFVGDAVAAVAAETREIAEEAIDLIEVEYEILPAILSPEKALEKGMPEIHEGTNNICGKHDFQVGNVEDGFKSSDFVYEAEYRTPIVQHCSLEPHVSLVYLDENERIIVHSSTQVPSHLRRILAKALGINMTKVKVIKKFVGGGFGGKAEICQEPINAVLALVTKRPVLLEYTREEEMVSARTRHSTIIKLKTGVTKEGKILAWQMKIISNTGAYSGHGHAVVYSIGSHFPTLYPAPNFAFEGISVYTNMPVASAMRSYGISQLNFAMESHMDSMALRLNIDPLKFRRINMIKQGWKDPLNYFTLNTCGLEECLKHGETLSNWEHNRKLLSNNNSSVKTGLGMACYCYETSAYPGVEEFSGARVRFNEDGTAVLFIGTAEIGQGNDTVMAQIAAEELGIPLEDIVVVAVDTDICPFDNGAYASRQLYIGGMAVKKAAIKCRELLLEYTANQLGKNPGKLFLNNGWICDGENQQKLLTIKDAVWQAHYNKECPITICAEEYHGAKCNPLNYGAVFALVTVDTGTGQITVERIWSIHDAGKIINPQLAKGQVYGGVLMGLGFGTSEELLVDPKTGRVLNDNLLDYKLATFMDVPPVHISFVETSDPASAYGNKGLGEPPCISVAPAIRNAVLHALGVEYNQIPLTPQRILLKLREVE
jgi:xanthine dehydrogenase molybdenum-binding subunit